MGKKKKGVMTKSGSFNKKIANDIADQLEEYVDVVSTMIIIDDKPKKDVKWAKKTVRKAIKDLRSGNEEEVFDMDAYEDFLDQMED